MRKKIIISLILVCTFTFLAAGCQQQEGISKDRRAKLLNALGSKNLELRLRAIEEIGNGIDLNKDKQARAALIDCLSSPLVEPFNPDHFLITKILAKVKKPSMRDEVFSAYSKSVDTEENFQKWLLLLGRMKRKAPNVSADLFQRVKIFESSSEEFQGLEGAVHIVSANIGYKSDENVATILSDIKACNERGWHEVMMMGIVGTGPWVNDDIINELIEYTKPKGDINDFVENMDYPIGFAAIYLGTLGERAKEAKANIQKIINCVMKDKRFSSARILFGLSLAKIDPKISEKMVKTVLKYMGSEEFGNQTDWDTINVAGILIDPVIIKQAGQCLDEKDPEIVKGSLNMFWWGIGLDGKEYAPKVIEILKTNPDEGTKNAAARALGYLASEKDVPELEKIIDEKLDNYSNASNYLRNSIDIINLKDTSLKLPW